MAYTLHETGDRNSHRGPDWHVRRERGSRILPHGLLLLAMAIGAGAIFLLGPTLIGDNGGVTQASAPTTISDAFTICDDSGGNGDGHACVLSADAYVWRGQRYHIADIRALTPDDTCDAPAVQSLAGRAALVTLLNGGTVEVWPGPADSDPASRLLIRDGVSLGQLMILKGYARSPGAPPAPGCAT